MLNRRAVIVGASAIVAAPLARPAFAAQPKELRIGFQKSGVLLIAKAQRLLEKRLAEQDVAVKWIEFAFGPPLLEALNAGAIDYGAVGDAPPIFAQAARANLVYVAAQPGRGDTQSIIVPHDSAIRSIADLKGKKVAIAKGSSAHSLAIAAVEAVGLTFKDIEAVYLAPADASAAFARGSIDAWSIWDPFYASAELKRNARPLPIPPEVAAQNSFFLANKTFTQAHPDIVSTVNDELAKATIWASDHRDEAAVLFSEASGVDLAAQKRTVNRTEFRFTPIDDVIAKQQQAVADRFFRVGLIPKPVNVRDIVWTWKPAA